MKAANHEGQISTRDGEDWPVGPRLRPSPKRQGSRALQDLPLTAAGQLFSGHLMRLVKATIDYDRFQQRRYRAFHYRI